MSTPCTPADPCGDCHVGGGRPASDDERGCDMVVGFKCDEHGEPGDEIECGAPIWLKSDIGRGYCRKHADETAAQGLDTFTPADAKRYQAQIAAERAVHVPADPGGAREPDNRIWPMRGITRTEFDKHLDFIVSDMTPEDAAWLRTRLSSYEGWETDPGRWVAVAAIEGAAEGSGVRFARMRDLSEALVGLASHMSYLRGLAAQSGSTPEQSCTLGERAAYKRGRREAIAEAAAYLRTESNHVGRVGCARAIEEHEAEQVAPIARTPEPDHG